ncbi:MAG: 2-oxoacid:acceptor oxidoreductase family protein [Bacteroidales bacterium]|jgi:pyruvate ferredoxin oxidoreductase gamma subunit|nr:2-oxoacid:acceptor oxidoreductase family protein [Bacteroidales bacterium]
MKEIRWHGRGGQGGFTASRLLGIAAGMFGGKHALAFPSFGPERRGAPVLAFTKIDDTKIHDRSEVQESDYVVIMDETLINPGIAKGIREGATVLVNTSDVSRYKELEQFNTVQIDATSIALEVLGHPITNTAMYGALVAASGLVSKEAAIESIRYEMKPSLVEKNIEIINRAFEQIKGN